MVLAVFFPSLMGVGIIASGAVLVSDALRRLFPNRGRRRRHRVAVGAYGVVALAAAAAGQDVQRSGLLDRVPRRRAAYALLAVSAAGTATLIAAACAAAYADPLGLFYRSPWMIGIGTGFGAALGVLALLLAVLSALGRRLPAPMARLVATTSLGRLQIPPEAVPTIERTRRGSEP
ncbi:MAG: hypothetical protein EHM57_02355 [Actinobacteria bacterium]|nr:MAG: hypothetical protein EHM57_02355 [Actinomycetota bacterium]